MNGEQPRDLLRERFDEAAGRIRPFASASLMWHLLLNREQREEVGGNLKKAFRRFGTAGIWMQVNNVSEGRAIVEIARGIGFLEEPIAQRLLIEMGEADAVAPNRRPEWNRDRGELSFRGEVVRTVRVGVATNVVQILARFHFNGWPDRIDNPWPSSDDPKTARNAVGSLNRGLAEIRFRMDGSGNGIVWERR
jgi:hypothetical protein